MTREEHFLSLVHPECRNIAEDFINGKIDAMFAEYCVYDEEYTKCGYGRCRIEIFENNPDKPSKIIEFNDSEHMALDDRSMIYEIVRRHGERHVYEALKKLDTDEKLRNRIMTMYMRFPSALITIVKKKCQQIYDSLSDSDKLLLEISDDNYGVLVPSCFITAFASLYSLYVLPLKVERTKQ